MSNKKNRNARRRRNRTPNSQALTFSFQGTFSEANKTLTLASLGIPPGTTLLTRPMLWKSVTLELLSDENCSVWFTMPGLYSADGKASAVSSITKPRILGAGAKTRLTVRNPNKIFEEIPNTLDVITIHTSSSTAKKSFCGMARVHYKLDEPILVA